MKVAILTTDNRWPHGEYEKPVPWFGMAPDALLSGFAAMPEEIEVHVISCIRQPVKSPEKLAENIWFHSLHVPKIGWMRTGYLGCIRAVRRRIRQIQPDLVHGQGTEYESAICAAFSGCANVLTLLGIMREMALIMKARPGSFYWFASALESLALRRTAGVLANSRFTENKIRDRTPKTWLVPNAVREVFFQRPLTAKGDNPPILLNAGLICANKRQNELLDVTDELHAEGLKFRVQFLGQAPRDNPYAARFLERIRNSEFASHHGFKSVSEMLDFYDRASCLVHVSQIESFGLVVAEALARNLKFIGFKTSGVSDIVDGVDDAEAFEDLDWAGFKAALRRWIEAGATRPRTASATMRERYHPIKIARSHLEVYREVVESRRTTDQRK